MHKQIKFTANFQNHPTQIMFYVVSLRGPCLNILYHFILTDFLLNSSYHIKATKSSMWKLQRRSSHIKFKNSKEKDKTLQETQQNGDNVNYNNHLYS